MLQNFPNQWTVTYLGSSSIWYSLHCLIECNISQNISFEIYQWYSFIWKLEMIIKKASLNYKVLNLPSFYFLVQLHPFDLVPHLVFCFPKVPQQYGYRRNWSESGEQSTAQNTENACTWNTSRQLCQT